MTRERARPLVEVFRENLQILEAEPLPITSEKAELMEYLRQRVLEHETLDALTADRCA